MDEYEVKVHALEDIEEGELTSDEEGEIKGQLAKKQEPPTYITRSAKCV